MIKWPHFVMSGSIMMKCPWTSVNMILREPCAPLTQSLFQYMDQRIGVCFSLSSEKTCLLYIQEDYYLLEMYEFACSFMSFNCLNALNFQNIAT